MGLTLVEAKKLSSDPLKEAVLDTFLEGELLNFLPFKNVDGSGVHYNQLEKLPGVGFRGYNEAHENSTGVLNPMSESLKLFGGDLDVDKAIINMEGPQARSVHTEAKVRAARMSFEANFINGDSSANPREFDGLKRRIRGNRLIDNSAGGAPLSLNVLDRAIQTTDAPGGRKIIICSRETQTRFWQVARSSNVGGFVNFTPLELGREIPAYMGVPIVSVDVDNENNPIMPFTEVSTNGANLQTTSIYVVALGDLLTTAIQGQIEGSYGPSVKDLGEIDAMPVYRTRLDWYMSMAIYNGRSVARVTGITDAPFIA
jgi:hypothetical protein